MFFKKAKQERYNHHCNHEFFVTGTHDISLIDAQTDTRYPTTIYELKCDICGATDRAFLKHQGTPVWPDTSEQEIRRLEDSKESIKKGGKRHGRI